MCVCMYVCKWWKLWNKFPVKYNFKFHPVVFNVISVKKIYGRIWNVLHFNLLATDFSSNFSTLCIKNVSNTETKQGSIMK